MELLMKIFFLMSIDVPDVNTMNVFFSKENPLKKKSKLLGKGKKNKKVGF